ncbi:MAG: ABC-three component system middle component 7 [Clostridium sp.]
MIFPNKLKSYEESILSKLPIVLNIILEGKRDVVEIYRLCENQFDEVQEYIYVLDILYMLNKIKCIEGGKIHVEADTE